jgi:hypothetical protein
VSDSEPEEKPVKKKTKEKLRKTPTADKEEVELALFSN